MAVDKREYKGDVFRQVRGWPSLMKVLSSVSGYGLPAV